MDKSSEPAWTRGAWLRLPALLILAAAAVGAAVLLARPRTVGSLTPSEVEEPCASWAAQAPLHDPGRPPEGWSTLLRLRRDGRDLIFGPVVGHYWRLAGPGGERICGLHYNTGRTSASAEHRSVLLYVVEGRAGGLPVSEEETPQPEPPYREADRLSAEAPSDWLARRPAEPGFVYWRSAYDPRSRAAVPEGFWLRHTALFDFVFDMGDPSGGYPFTHSVRRGIDAQFAPKFVFDAGP